MAYVRVFDNETQVAGAAAVIIASAILHKPNVILGLATGSTPIPTYRELIRLYQNGVLDFSRVITFNLDEYCHLPAEHACSYHYFMRKHLFENINISAGNTHLPNGNAPDLAKEGIRYDMAIETAGGIDLQLLGIGRNGHIGFNEPAEQFTYESHVADLTPSTMEANSRFFEEEDMPFQAISMGIGSIMSAKEILLIATGMDKAEAIRKSLQGDIRPQIQASILRTHPKAVYLLDQAAASQLDCSKA